MYFFLIGLLLVSLISWYAIIALYILECVYILQLKEYRMDRIRDYLSSQKGRTFFARYFSLAIVSIGIVSMIADGAFLFAWYIILLLGAFYAIRRYGLLRPVWTKKAVVLTGTAFVVYMICSAYISNIGSSIGFGLLHIVLPVLIFLISQIYQIPTYAAKRYYIAQATKKLATYTNLRVIGITGSYGKTSTRNFLMQVLSTQYRAVTTPKNINTDIGVARFILDHDFSSDDIFVVEMGAYAKGEIKLIADMVQPEIGIITTIGPEHLALFGTMENIRETKGELFEALPKHGLAISLANNSYCRELMKRAQTHTNVISFGAVPLQHPTLLVSAVQQEEIGIQATFSYLGIDVKIIAPLYGAHHALNIATVYITAMHLGMDQDMIISAVATLTAPPHRLCRIVKEDNTVILDDTYNSNPEGFLEALDVLALQPQSQKVVITRGMLELGSKEIEEHVRIGARIGEVADQVIIISADNALHLKQGIIASGRTLEIIEEYDMRSVVALYRGIIEAGNVAILLENRVPQDMLDIR
jgi:UDP-N-acetylmuramoyl-tripeptide--D-alanyl-D-alanine ligase